MSKFSEWLESAILNYRDRYGKAALARDLGIRRATVSDWTSGKHKPPRVYIQMLALHFGTTSRHIYELLGDDPPDDLNDTYERVSSLVYKLNPQQQQKILDELRGKYAKKD